MVCRHCGATIAEKAIICYKCGTATAPPVGGGMAGAGTARRSRVPGWVWVLIVAIVTGLLWWRLR